MTDDLDALKAALRATPAPSATAKAAAMKLAMENFDRLQGSTDAPRPNQDRPKQAGFLKGVFAMLNSLTSRQALAATTSVAALCLGVVLVLPLSQSLPPNAPVIVDSRIDSGSAALADGGATKTPDGDAAVAIPPNSKMAAAGEAEVAPAPQEPVLAEPLMEDAVEQDQRPATLPPAAIADSELAPPIVATEMADTMLAKPAAPAEGAFGGVVSRLRVDNGVANTGAAADALAAAPMAEAPFDQALMPMVENTEAFASAPANPVKVTTEEPVSTLSIDVDTASYAVVRSSLAAGQLPDPQSVRVEEMINYFPYANPAPDDGAAPFRQTVTVMPTPWNAGTQLVHIALQGRLPAVVDRPPLNLVFLIDTSGSMDEPNKLPLLKQSLAMMLSELRPEDEVAIVAYAGSAGTVLEPTKAGDRNTILRALDNLAAGGSTAGAEGLALAYQVAETMGGGDQVSRVLLMTDGDFNVGIDDPEGLESYIAKKRDTGVYLSVVGFGRGNLDDATMQALAQNGNGTAAYIDTLNEARKVLVDQLTGALFTIADDVKIQVEWNPANVAEYRLIGYETRALRREDFNNDTVDAGEIGAGHSVTAIYEVTAPGSAALRNDPLRYGADVIPETTAELGFLRLRYKAPGEDASALIESPIVTGNGPASDDARFAVAIAGFGQLLTNSVYLGDWGWDQAIDLALKSRGEDAYGYRIEAVNLMRMAKTLDAQ